MPSRPGPAPRRNYRDFFSFFALLFSFFSFSSSCQTTYLGTYHFPPDGYHQARTASTAKTTSTTTNTTRIEKYRPESLQQIHGQHEIIATVSKFIHSAKLPHLLFYGPPGTGKTSTILAVAREIYGPNYKNMVLELNASDDRGIDVVRNQIKDFASTMQIFSRGFKLIILDEADAMTAVAQNSLRRIIEKYTKTTRFCIIANYAHKLNPALVSRCTRFRFQPLDDASVRERVDAVITAERVPIDRDAVDNLVHLAAGDMRKALNVLQACKATGEPVDLQMVYDCVGAPAPGDLEMLVDAIAQDDWTSAYTTVIRVKNLKGLALVDVVVGIVQIMARYEMDWRAGVEFLKGMSEIEYGVGKGNDKIGVSAMIGVVRQAMESRV